MSISRTGIEGDGIITAVLGIVIVIAGIGTRRGGRSWITALIASLITLGVAWLEFQDVQERVDSVGDAVYAAVGVGIWVILAGAAISILASLATSGATSRGKGRSAGASPAPESRQGILLMVGIAIFAAVAFLMLANA